MLLTKKIFNIKLDADKKRLLENFFSLSVLQGANYILPLITLPYLVRVLGPEKFGLIMFAQAFIQYFNILTDYGFNLSATREISMHRDNEVKVSEIFSSVIIIKFGLLLLSFLIMSLMVIFFEKFRENWLIYYLTFGIVIGQAMFPVWFFQGMEKMRYITFLNISAKIFFVSLVFLFVHHVSDYIYVPFFYSLGYLLSGFLSLYIAIKRFNIRVYFPSLVIIGKYLKDSSQFFLSRLSVSVYTSTNTFILGLFTDNKIVGYYSMAEKLYIALQQVYQPIVNSLYPYVAHERNVCFYKKIFKLVIIVNLVIVFLMFGLSNHIVELIFGSSLDVSIKVFRILLLSALVVVPSILLGYPFLAALGFPSYANTSVIIGSLLHLSMLGILAALDIINIYSVAFMVVITETIVFSVRLYGVIKHRLWRME